MGLPQDTTELELDDLGLAMRRLKKHVFRNRIRLRDFITDHDKLRKGLIFPGQFKTALSIAGIEKFLTFQEIDTIASAYTVQQAPSLVMVQYRPFLQEVDSVFTTPVSGPH